MILSTYFQKLCQEKMFFKTDLTFNNFYGKWKYYLTIKILIINERFKEL